MVTEPEGRARKLATALAGTETDPGAIAGRLMQWMRRSFTVVEDDDDALRAAGIKRVVTGIEDPDPRVAGRGLDKLRAAGLEVTRGVLAPDVRWVTRGHIVRVTERRPLVTLKMALAADGSAPRGTAGQPSWVTGPLARARGQLLRAEADAILAGAQTVRDDDPELTCRLPGLLDRSPVRVVVSDRLDVPLNSKVLATARATPVWIITGSQADTMRKAALEAAGAEIIYVTDVGGKLWLPAIMEALVARGITRLLVEGGPSVWRAFGAAALVDEVALFAAGPADAIDPVTRAQAWLGALPLKVTGKMNVEPDTLWRLGRSRGQEGM
jgi:diaminohydroxyphosphoribosylaminopyrimidine deaminase/5-amino-6-(5-phosphoribosylamino)uracil reductase